MADESLADYTEFLQSKFKFSTAHGFDVADDEITPCLFPHQRDIVRWAVKGGKRAIFAAFGLGKTAMQIETLRLLHKREPGRYLVIAPLGVRRAIKLGYIEKSDVLYARTRGHGSPGRKWRSKVFVRVVQE